MPLSLACEHQSACHHSTHVSLRALVPVPHGGESYTGEVETFRRRLPRSNRTLRSLSRQSQIIADWKIVFLYACIIHILSSISQHGFCPFVCLVSKATYLNLWSSSPVDLLLLQVAIHKAPGFYICEPEAVKPLSQHGHQPDSKSQGSRRQKANEGPRASEPHLESPEKIV